MNSDVARAQGVFISPCLRDKNRLLAVYNPKVEFSFRARFLACPRGAPASAMSQVSGFYDRRDWHSSFRRTNHSCPQSMQCLQERGKERSNQRWWTGSKRQKVFTPLARHNDDGNNDNAGRYCFVWSAIGVDKLRLRALKTPLCVFVRVLQQHIPRRGKAKKREAHSGEYKILSKIVPVKCDAEPKKLLLHILLLSPPYKVQFTLPLLENYME